jgi:hypothetical protein
MREAFIFIIKEDTEFQSQRQPLHANRMKTSIQQTFTACKINNIGALIYMRQ